MTISLMVLLALIPTLIVWGVIIYVVYLLIVALRKYIKSKPVREEKEEYAKTLGGVIKKHRMECQMTQEFVAETLGVSRQAVSKWENGSSDPSMTNLIALANLFDINLKEMLKEIQQTLQKDLPF
ncbi:helix-turn-helix domain-containing protein [Catenibacterium sp.]|uniref:helix-turn-helix domain-containing protein n=1 Tax=Catenibacterium sp. TaxID=2049022 RepID=UPI003D7731A4